jgi:hypothetical protein
MQLNASPMDRDARARPDERAQAEGRHAADGAAQPELRVLKESP